MTTKEKLNEAVKKLAAKDRPAAVAILAKFKIITTAELRPEDIAAAYDAFIEALDASTSS